MTLEEKYKQECSLRIKSWHKAYLSSYTWKIRDRHNEIIWFADISNISLRSKIQVDGDVL